MQKYFISLLILVSLLFSCQPKQTPTAEEIAEESAKANRIYQAYFDEMLSMSPEFQTWLGIKSDYDKWDDLSDEHSLQYYAMQEKYCQMVKDSLRPAYLNEFAKLAYDNFAIIEKGIEGDRKYRLYNYPVNQMFGLHTSVVSTMMSQHVIDSISDAKAYISRIEALDAYFDQLIAGLKMREDSGIVLPKHLFPKVIETSQNLISSIQANDAKEHILYNDFKTKLEKLELGDEEKESLLDYLHTALLKSFSPAYNKLITFLKDQETRANSTEGVYKFPDGEAYYNYALCYRNTMPITPDEIYDLGVKEVDRIQSEMKEIMRRVEFEGDFQQFLTFMREDKQFYLETTDENKAMILDSINLIVDNMWAKIDDYFNIKPKASLEVKAVEPYREKAAGFAFYESPAEDGSRPGYYYINLYDLSAVATYELEALTYHEAIPGHHFNITIAQELENIPQFMKYQTNTAHVEGWGLYCEYLAKEMGAYSDPYSDFGRLNMELFRAVRLVVDAGIHYKKWGRQEAIDYYMNNTSSSLRRCTQMVDRHMVMPAQATAYKVGMIKLLEFRAKAQKALGDKYNIKDFHDAVLKYGLLPMEMVEALVDEYILQQKDV